MRRAVCLVALLPALGVTACQPSNVVPAGRVVKLAVKVETEPAGALLIRETYDLEADSIGAIRFHRSIASDRADGVVFAGATVDDTVASPGSDGFDVRTRDTGRIDVSWTPAPVNNARRTLTLSVRALSAVAVTEPRAGLTWPLAPRNRGYAIERLDAELVLPPGAPIYPGTGVLEGGWLVARTAAGITASKSPVGDGETATLVASFDFNRAGVADPVWERNLDRQRQFLPALVAGALFFFAIGAGTIVILRAQYPSRKNLAKTGRTPPAEADRQIAARGLVIAGMAGAAVAAASAALAAALLSSLGAWVQIIPGSMLLVAVSFVVFAPRLRS